MNKPLIKSHSTQGLKCSKQQESVDWLIKTLLSSGLLCAALLSLISFLLFERYFYHSVHLAVYECRHAKTVTRSALSWIHIAVWGGGCGCGGGGGLCARVITFSLLSGGQSMIKLAWNRSIEWALSSHDPTWLENNFACYSLQISLCLVKGFTKNALLVVPLTFLHINNRHLSWTPVCRCGVNVVWMCLGGDSAVLWQHRVCWGFVGWCGASATRGEEWWIRGWCSLLYLPHETRYNCKSNFSTSAHDVFVKCQLLCNSYHVINHA